MTPSEKLRSALVPLKEIQREFVGANAGLLEQYLIAADLNWSCSRILPTSATYRFMVKKFRKIEKDAKNLADLFESCPSRDGEG